MSGSVKQVSATEVDERLAALRTNANAIEAIASAVEGTLGPKGLNCMLVDRFGDVTITNDGSTILQKIDTDHPAARLLINTARAQDDEVGDGTTTATILASTLIQQGVAYAARGVPLTKIIEGLRAGVAAALDVFEREKRELDDWNEPLLRQAALIAGREDEEVADLAVEAARRVPREKLVADEGFRLGKCVFAKVGAKSEVVSGLVIDKERMNRQMPREVAPACLLVVDDALEPEAVEDDALGTDSGFQKYLQYQDEFRANLQRIVEAGVNVVVAQKGIHDQAEELFTEAGVMALRRISRRDLAKIVEHTGARPLKRSGLKKPTEELQKFTGTAERVYQDERLEHVRILSGGGEPAATAVVGAATREVKEERQRIAEDATAAVQAAARGGVLPGGGAIEIAAIRAVEKVREAKRGMAAYGVDCVIEALKRPLAQIVANAGFNALEKVEDVIAAQAESGNCALAVDCDTGEVVDMYERGVVDPALVKSHALRAAAEIAEATLRINTIIRKKEEGPDGKAQGESGSAPEALP